MVSRITTAMMALTGLIFFAAFVSQDLGMLPNAETGQLPWGLIIRYAIAMAGGGALAGFLLRGLFGRGTFGGWLLAGLGGILASLIAGIFGSAFGLLPDLLADGFDMADLVQAAFGVLVVPLTILEQPILLLVLLGMIVGTHIMAKSARNRVA